MNTFIHYLHKKILQLFVATTVVRKLKVFVENITRRGLQWSN